ncbi:sugar transferase [Terribacillus sp. 7520-G]|uniref:sugar transferase n=1 Tax=Terribacillus sp. 7520-G TaxID=2025389 RepID=UPI000BA713A1|nr:sugar transferase [Terribacillus sp. 7520-G]PAD40402.1 lipid carrier--UDP-N-acetylgalactosaminyltransferase [Terribacillus sp. 7520-G]
MYVYLKKFIDFTAALLSLLLLWPIILLIALIIKIDSKGPVLFKQKRVGIGKKTFYIYKFRTMRVDTPKDMPTHMLEDPYYFITRVGKFLRKSSLDELPQLFNIIKGEMSIVGPRPALWNQKDLINERDKHGANDIYPGLTGWAQINGRDELPIKVKAVLDGEYVEKMSFSFDCLCIIKTLTSIFKGSGIVEGSYEKQDNKQQVHMKKVEK